MPFGDYGGPYKSVELKPGGVMSSSALVITGTFKVSMLVSEEQQNLELRRFVKKVADYSNDSWLARLADELMVLYGDPDGTKPSGVINAAADRVHPA